MQRITQLIVIAGLVSLSTPAFAHLGLISPPSRYGQNVLKDGPCGMGDGPRSQNVTTYEPGETITVVWDEYINHPGHYRIAFDADGQDDFVDPNCIANCDTREMEFQLNVNDAVLMDGIEDKGGGMYEIQVTLPDVECENCTLQVIQVMTDKPPYTVGGNDNYYQCADLRLVAGGGGDTDMGTGTPDMGGGTPDMGSTPANNSTGNNTAGNNTAGNNAMTNTGGTGDTTNDGADNPYGYDYDALEGTEDDKACSSTGSAPFNPATVLLFALGFVAIRLRRR